MTRDMAIADLLHCGAVDKTVECGFWQPSQYEGPNGKRFYELTITKKRTRRIGFQFDYSGHTHVFLQTSKWRSYNIGFIHVPIAIRYFGTGTDYLLKTIGQKSLYITASGVLIRSTDTGELCELFVYRHKKHNIVEHGDIKSLQCLYMSHDDFRNEAHIIEELWSKLHGSKRI